MNINTHKILSLIYLSYNSLNINTLEYITFVTDTKRRIFIISLVTYKLTSIDDKIFSNKKATILRLKD